MNLPASPTVSSHTAALRVLVVDDTATNRQILQVFLKKLGFEVVSAADGAQAIEQFTATRPDLVLMDVMMPVMDGYEATRRIKAMSGDRWVPVVFLSALDKEENLVAGLDAGGDDYLSKPINFVVLDAKLRSITRSIHLQRTIDEHRASLQHYYDEREEENVLARGIIDRQMLRPGLEDPSIAHWFVPADNFSGDIVAAGRSSDNKLYAMVADATGHGLSAAITVVPVLTVFYGLVEQGFPIGYIAYEINRQMLMTLPPGRFVAASMLCIDQANCAVEIWVGGMPDILQLDAEGKVKERFASTHMPLGIVEMADEMDTVQRTTCCAGDQFAMFSDGLIEAESPEGESFGLSRFEAALAGKPISGRLAALQSAVNAHLGTGKSHDDVSLLMVSCP
jgi:CheY-like chemotaxis protein